MLLLYIIAIVPAYSLLFEIPFQFLARKLVLFLYLLLNFLFGNPKIPKGGHHQPDSNLAFFRTPLCTAFYTALHTAQFDSLLNIFLIP